jgi:hypothetical protein
MYEEILLQEAVHLALDMNRTVQFDPPLMSNIKDLQIGHTKEAIIREIILYAADLKPTDQLSAESKKTLDKLNIGPWVTDREDWDEIDILKSTSGGRFTRTDAIIFALKEGDRSYELLAWKADRIWMKYGGKSSIKWSRELLHRYLPLLRKLHLLTINSKGIKLKLKEHGKYAVSQFATIAGPEAFPEPEPVEEVKDDGGFMEEDCI